MTLPPLHTHHAQRSSHSFPSFSFPSSLPLFPSPLPFPSSHQVMSINRVGQPLPFVMLIGAMVSCLGFGLVVMLGQFQPTHTHIWRQAVGSVMADAAIGAAFTVAAGLLVLPSLATDELRSRVATTLRGVGKAASRWVQRVRWSGARVPDGWSKNVAYLHCEMQTRSMVPPCALLTQHTGTPRWRSSRSRTPTSRPPAAWAV